MTVALQALRQELTSLRALVVALEKAEAIVASACEPTPTPTPEPAPEEPAIAKHDSRARSRRYTTRAQVRDLIVTHGPLTRGEILRALGGRPKTMDKKLKILLDDGEITADGRPGARRYRAPSAKGRPRGGGSAPIARQASSSIPERGVYPVYDAIADRGTATTAQLARATKQPTAVVVEQGRRLVQLGLVQFRGEGGERVWRMTDAAIGRDAA
jgi:hypothetical protein